MDLGVGLIPDALKETKHAQDTLVHFLSDNGILFHVAKTTFPTPVFTCR
jgi:arylsulfatase A-like enzyme